MALESKEWPYHMFTHNTKRWAYIGRYNLWHGFVTFDPKENTYDYVGSIPTRYFKLADREWVEW